MQHRTESSGDAVPLVSKHRTTCPGCLANAGAAPANPQRRALRVEKLEEVYEALNQGTRPTEEERSHRHSAHVDGIVVRYKLRHSIACEMPDKTPHNIGFVVETRCNRRVLVGHECARKDIDGFDEAVKHSNDVDAWHRDIAEIATMSVLADRAVALADEGRSRLDYILAVRANVPDLHGTMTRRRVQGAKGTEVEGFDEKRKPVRGHLVGMELWDRPPGIHRGTVEVLRDDILEATADGPPSPERARALAKKVRSVRSEVRKMERYLESARMFFTRGNIDLVCVAMGGKLKVGPEGGLVFASANSGNLRELRSDGLLYQVPPSARK